MFDVDFVDTWRYFYTSGTSPAGFLAVTLEEVLKGPPSQYITTRIALKTWLVTVRTHLCSSFLAVNASIAGN